MISRFHLLLILAIFDSWFIWNIYAVRTHLQQMPGEQIIRKIVKSTDNEMFSATANQSYLSPLLIDRPAGSKNLERIRQHLVQFFHRLEWSIEWDNFTAETPLGSIPMANLIVTHRPQALRKVVLACHYETKREPVGFVGATDSAGPMALLLSLAEWIGPLLGSNSGSDNGSGVGANKRSPYTVQLIFFDGEEAMKFWTETDSLYGSRNLHSRWSAKGSSIVPLEEFNHWPNIAAMKPKGYENRLEEIDLLLLLDLLGATEPWPVFYNYFEATSQVHEAMLRIELELKRLHLLSVIRLKSAIEYFADEKPSAVPLMNPQDDHLPFLRSGVPVTHLIPQPFPAVWHTMDDDGSAINPEVLDDYSRILRVFLTQYMQLESAIRQT